MRDTEPTTINIGERIEWTKSYSGYSAADYTLQYRFRGDGPGVNVDGTADDASFIAELTVAQSGTMSVTKYMWQAWLTEIADTTNTFIIEEGSVNVKQGFASALTAVDLRSPAKIALDAIDAVLANAATSDQLEYEISTPAGSRRIKRMSRDELIKVRSHYAAIVSNERLAERLRNGGPFAKTVLATLRSR